MSDSQASESAVLTSRADGVGTITLNRPKVRNAINGELLQGLSEGMQSLEADPDVAVIVLTGSDPAFCAGVDLRDLGSGKSSVINGTGAVSAQPFPGMTKPVIGAINGPAVTGGFELALNCDFLIASELSLIHI